MPIYKVVKLPTGKKTRLRKGASNRGGETLYWEIDNVKGKHDNYDSALKRLQAIKATQRRKTTANRMNKHPKMDGLFSSTKINTPKQSRLTKRKRPISGYTTKNGKKVHPYRAFRHMLRNQKARTVVLPQHQQFVSVEDQLARLGEEATYVPVVEEERRRIGRGQPEGRMRAEELKPFFLFDKPVIPPQPVPGRLSSEEMHQLQFTRPSQIQYLRWDHDLEDYVVDSRLLRDDQPIEMIKGIDLETADYLKKNFNIYTVGDYREGVQQFIDKNPDLMTMQEYMQRDITDRKRNVIKMWRQLPPAAQDQVWLQLDEIANIDPDTVPEDYGLRETERVITQALAQYQLQQESEQRLQELKEPSKAGRPQKFRTIKELEDARLKIITNKNLSRGNRNRMAGRLSREIAARRAANKLDRKIKTLSAAEAKLGELEEGERFILATGEVDKPSKSAVRKAIKNNFSDGQITIGRISYQPRNIEGKKPIEEMANNPENHIDTFLFIDKEPAQKYRRSGQKARLYDPLYLEGDAKFLLENKQANYSGIQYRASGKIERLGGRTYYNKDDINSVLAAIESPDKPYAPARYIGEDAETKELPYLLMGGLGQPLVFSTKKGYFAVQPTKVVVDDPKIRSRLKQHKKRKPNKSKKRK